MKDLSLLIIISILVSILTCAGYFIIPFCLKYFETKRRIKAYKKLHEIAQKENDCWKMDWNTQQDRWFPKYEPEKHPILFTKKEAVEQFAKNNKELYEQILKD